MNYCQCGCGGEIKPQRRFLLRHNLRLKGEKHHSYGKPLSSEIKEKISKSHLGKKHTYESRMKMSKNRSGEKHNYYGKSRPLSTRIKLSQTKIGSLNPMWGKHPISYMKGKKHTNETKILIAKASRERWTNQEYREKTIRNIIKASQVKPNYKELRLFDFLNKILPEQYDLNIKAEIMILGGKIPDIVNINGKKKLIEFYGRRWHKPEDEEKRIREFKKYGWDTLIIWEEELNNLNILGNKIIKFHEDYQLEQLRS